MTANPHNTAAQDAPTARVGRGVSEMGGNPFCPVEQ